MKIAVFLLISIILGVFVIRGSSNKDTATPITDNENPRECTSDPRLDFILGSWSGTGFITDANGLQQYVEIKENNSSISNIQYQIAGSCKNPSNRFVYVYNKNIYYNTTLTGWYTNGKINDIILPDSRTTLGENDNLSYSYSYYDLNSILVRHSTVRETEDSFTETQEKWGQNGWDKTAWFRMTRVVVK